MAEHEGGYVRIHRRLIGHPVFRNDAEAMAFAWLICRASWKQTRVRYKGRAIVLERGQVSISVRDFADAMDRDKAWIERLLRRLRGETMIASSDETGVNVITICNYAEYQAGEASGETLNETPHETSARQTRDTEQRTEEGKKQEEASPLSRSPPQPVGEAVQAWNTAAKSIGWPCVTTLSDARRRALGARLREHGPEGWLAALSRAESSPYLGRDPPSWFTFDWLIKAANFTKVTDGNYDRAHQSGSRNGAGADLYRDSMRDKVLDCLARGIDP